MVGSRISQILLEHYYCTPLHKTVSSRVMSYLFEPSVPKFSSISLFNNPNLTFRARATFDGPFSVNFTVPSTLAHLECPQSSPSRPILIRLPLVASTSTNFGRLSRKNRFYTRAQLVVFGRDVSNGHLNFSCGRGFWILWTSGSLGSVFTRGYLNLISSCFSGGTLGDEPRRSGRVGCSCSSDKLSGDVTTWTCPPTGSDTHVK